MGIFSNLDLLSVGVAISAIGILGFTVFLNNRKSITNRNFLYFSIITILWGIANYFNYQIKVPDVAFWFLRLTIFFAVFQAYFIFRLFFVFPDTEFKYPNYVKYGFLPISIVTAILTLTPTVFSRIGELSGDNQIIKLVNGPGIYLFGLISVGLIASGIVHFIKRSLMADKDTRKQFIFVAVGISLSFILIIIFNFILPAFFDNPKYISLGAVFLLPFIGFTSYAIIKHHLLNIKVITTEILTFVLAVVTLIEIILSRDLGEIVFRSGIFIVVLSFGILLIRSVWREVVQREKLESLTKDLEAANQKLTELDKLKSEFLSFASHQIKSPIAVIKGFSSLIFDGSYGEVNQKVKDTAFKMEEAADRLINLVDEFLDMRRIEEGKMEYNFENVNLIEAVEKVFDELKNIAQSKGLAMVFDKPKEISVKIKADPRKIHHVIQNLIDNAIKYTDKGFVNVKIRLCTPSDDSSSNIIKCANENSVLFIVQDSGRGLSENLVNHLFEEFSRGSATSKEIKGTGLGLYIAKQVVDAHKGEIWAESEGEGKGSTFYVKLPLAE